MAIELIDMIYNFLAVEVLGHPLLLGITLASFCISLLIALSLPKWAIMSYSTPIILSLCAPNYHPLLLPEWVFYVVLIFLGILWGQTIIKIKGG